MRGLVKPITFGPVVIDGNYPHMAKRDAPVWERWVKLHGEHWQGVAYDVAIGGLEAAGEVPDPAADRMWQYMTALKIDAMLIREDQALVVEVRPYATVSALGACLSYAMVLERIGAAAVPLVPAIVCEGIQTDVDWCCAQMRIPVFKV
jgi:hypothetical protein